MSISETDFKSLLGEVGLKPAEISVYLALGDVGSHPVSIVAQRAGLKRGQVYNVLESLVAQGLAVQVGNNGGSKRFRRNPPNSLLGALDKRLQQLSTDRKKMAAVVMDMTRALGFRGKSPKVEICHGISGVMKVCEDMLDVGEDIYAALDGEYMFPECAPAEAGPEWHEWIEDYIARRSNKDQWYYSLTKASPGSDDLFKKRTRTKRKSKKIHDVDLKVEIMAYGPKVAVISPQAGGLGVILEMPDLAETLRSAHKTLWHFLPDYSLDSAETEHPRQDGLVNRIETSYLAPRVSN